MSKYWRVHFWGVSKKYNYYIPPHAYKTENITPLSIDFDGYKPRTKTVYSIVIDYRPIQYIKECQKWKK
jgi:hypothetical protein